MLHDNEMTRLPALDEAVMSGMLEVVSDGLWDWNANTGYVHRYPGWYQMLGYEPHSLDNTVFTWENLIHPDDLAQVMESFDACLSGRAADYRAEYRCRCRNGDYLWVADCGRIVARNPDGSVARMVGAHRNIHAQRELYARLELQNRTLEQQVAQRTAELERLNQALQFQVEENRRLAETDSLTGAASRYRLEQAVRLEHERAKRFKEPFAVIAMDVDDFKQINDRHGHGVGDQTLIDIVQLTRGCIREIDLLARWGGGRVHAGASQYPVARRPGGGRKAEAAPESCQGQGDRARDLEFRVGGVRPRRAGVPPDGEGRQGALPGQAGGQGPAQRLTRALVGAATGLFPPEYGLTKGFS